jgi:hypothetical protein
MKSMLVLQTSKRSLSFFSDSRNGSKVVLNFYNPSYKRSVSLEECLLLFQLALGLLDRMQTN